MLLQGTVSAQGRFIDVHAGVNGRRGDAKTFEESQLGKGLARLIPHGYQLLADKVRCIFSSCMVLLIRMLDVRQCSALAT